MKEKDYPTSVKVELAFPGDIGVGAEGMEVKRVQEWLTFHKTGTLIDSEYGSATAAAVKKFQSACNLGVTGTVDEATWEQLTAPMRKLLAEGTGNGFRARVTSLAKQHLAVRPVELGGDNCGPWVRMYMGGEDGVTNLWCAGFVSFILRQAAAELGRPIPIRGSRGCDKLYKQAKAAELLVTEANLEAGANWSDLGSVYIFLSRKSPGNWDHTGFGFGGSVEAFDTIEGNGTSTGGHSYEVCSRSRSGVNRDFICIPD